MMGHNSLLYLYTLWVTYEHEHPLDNNWDCDAVRRSSKEYGMGIVNDLSYTIVYISLSGVECDWADF